MGCSLAYTRQESDPFCENIFSYTVDSWYSGFLRQWQNVHYFKSSTISREPIKKAWWVSNQAENYHKFKSIYYIQVNWTRWV